MLIIRIELNTHSTLEKKTFKSTGNMYFSVCCLYLVPSI